MESFGKVNCNACLHAPENVPYIVHESAQARMERTARRLWVTVLILIALLVGTNAAWLWYESQFETVDVVQDIDAGAGGIDRANIFGAGDFYGAYPSGD